MQQRTRRIVAGFLVVVGGIVLAVSSIGWWAEKSLLNTAHVTSEANTILAENDVQTALTQVVVRQLSRALPEPTFSSPSRSSHRSCNRSSSRARSARSSTPP